MMSAKNLVIKHGEKLLVVLSVAIGALLTYRSISDPATAPRNDAGKVVRRTELDNSLQAIERASTLDVRPKLMEPLDYADLLDARLSGSIPERPVVQFLTYHPTYGIKGSEFQARPYVYEAGAPTVDTEADMQGITLAVTLPESTLGDRQFASDAAAETWSRQVVEGKRLRNKAGWRYLVLEWRAKGADAWRPLVLERAPQGWVQLGGRGASGREMEFRLKKSAAAELGIELIEWHTYEFRGRLVVSATGWPRREEVKEEDVLESEVLVFERGRAADVPVEAEALTQFVVDLLEKHHGRLPGMLPEIEPPTGIAAAEGQALYATPWSDPQGVTMPSSIRFVLKGVSGFLEPAEATFIVVRQLDDGTWTEPEEFRVKIGQGEGEDYTLGRKVKKQKLVDGRVVYYSINLETPFVVKAFDDKVERITHYEIRMQRQPVPDEVDLPPGKLGLEPKTRLTERVVLHNTTTGQETEMFAVEVFNVSSEADKKGLRRRLVSPNHPAGRLDEKELFLADPLNFVQPSLVPEKPTYRPPEPQQDGQVWKLSPADLQWFLAEAEQAGVDIIDPPVRPVVLCPDGRILFLNGIEENARKWGVQFFYRKGAKRPARAGREAAGKDDEE